MEVRGSSTHPSSARRLLAVAVGAVLVALVGVGCSSVIRPPATPCQGVAGWPPVGLPAPPASIVVAHPPGSAVRVTNGTDAPVKIRYRVWTPLDCGLSPPFDIRDNGWVAAPGKLADWSANDLVPSAGPVLGGIEVWTHPCDETCSDPPDPFVSFELPIPLR